MPINQLRVREILIGRGWLEEEIRVFLEELEQRDDDLARKSDIELLRQATQTSIDELRRETQAGFAQQTQRSDEIAQALADFIAKSEEQRAADLQLAEMNRQADLQLAEKNRAADLQRAAEIREADHLLFEERFKRLEAQIQSVILLIEAEREARRSESAAAEAQALEREARAMAREARRDRMLLGAVAVATGIVVGVLSALHFFA